MTREKIKTIVKPYLRDPGCKEDCRACENEAGDLADKILQVVEEDKAQEQASKEIEEELEKHGL